MKKLNLLFIVSKSRIRKDGKAPLFCRLTYLERRKQFSTGLFINPKNWNNSLQECEPPSNDNNYINSQLNLIKHPYYIQPFEFTRRNYFWNLWQNCLPL